MKNKRIIANVIMFFFLTVSLVSNMGIQAFGEPTAATATPASNIPKLTFVQKPFAEYVAGSKVNLKVSVATANKSKIQISAKLYELDKSIKVSDVMNYGKVYNDSEVVPMSMTIKESGRYRIAIYTRLNGTVGTIKGYYDNYITFDFKIAKASAVEKPTVTVDPIKVNADLLSSYVLPKKINGKTSTGQVKQYDVVWDKVASTKKAGTFQFSGKVKELNSKVEIKNLKAKLTLVVEPLPSFTATTKAAVILNEEFKLPTKIYGKMKNGKLKEYGVTWDKPVKTTSPGAFTFIGTVKNLSTKLVVKNVNPKLILTVYPLPTFEPITATVDEGAAFTLPKTTAGKLSNGTTKQYEIKWDKEASTTKPGTTVFTGEIYDTNTHSKLKDAKIKLTLTVREGATFEPLVASVIEGTNYLLPDTINGKLSSGSAKSYAVTWNGKANTSVVGSYDFVGTIKDTATGVILNAKAGLKLIVLEKKPEVLSLKVENPKTFSINFSKKVDTSKCNFTTSINDTVVAMNPIWQSDGKSVAIQSQNALEYGTYSIKISGIDIDIDSYKIELAKPILKSIAIPTAYLAPNTLNAKIFVSGIDQYGQDMAVSADDFTWKLSVTTSGIGLTPTVSNQNYISVSTSISGIKNGDRVELICVNKKDNTINKTVSLEINTKPIDSLALGQPVLGTGVSRISSKTEATYYEISYTAYQNITMNGVATQTAAFLSDRNEISLGQIATLNNYYFITDKPDVLTAIKVENGKLYVKVGANKSGVVKLSATLIPEIGQTSTAATSTITINIQEPSLPSTITLGKTTSTLTVGGTVIKIPVTVYDQYGEVIEPDVFARTNFADFVFMYSNTTVASAMFDSDGKSLVIVPMAVGTTNISIINRNSMTSVVYPATVNAASVVKSFGAKLDYTQMVKGAFINMNLIAYDQYGNKLSSVGSTYKYALAATNGSTLVRLSTNNISVNLADSFPIAITGLTAGKTETITVILYNDLNNNNLIDSNEAAIDSHPYSVYTVSDSEILNYTMNPVETVYAAVAQDKSNQGITGDAFGAVQNQNNKNLLYARTISMKATRLDGTPVALLGNPISDISITNNENAIGLIAKNGLEYIVIGRQWSGAESTKEVELLISYVDNSGTKRSISTMVTVSKASLTATAMKLMINIGKDNIVSNDFESYNMTVSLSQADFNLLNGRKLIENQNLSGIPCYIEVRDQYGVTSMNPFDFTVDTKKSSLGNFTFNSDGTIATNGFVSGDSVTIHTTDAEGHKITITLRVQ